MLWKAALFTALCAALSAAPKSVFIFEGAPSKSCHASTIAETKPGAFPCRVVRGRRGGQAERGDLGVALRERTLE